MAVIEVPQPVIASPERRAASAAEAPLSAIVRDLVVANRDRLFPGEAATEIVAVETGTPKYPNENRFHRPVTVHYRRRGVTGVLPIWLKFRPGLDRLYPVLVGYHDRLAGDLIPKPYFAWHSADEEIALVASASIRATPLRDRLLFAAALGRAGKFAAVFRAHGAKMRRFHDAFPTTETLYAHDVAATVEAAIRATPYLSVGERAAVLAHAARAASVVGIKPLPAVRNHNDWILRNIVVAADGTDYLIDCDSMRYRPNWRWYDVVFLLLNLESARKWAPLLGIKTLSRLGQAFWQGYVGDGPLPDGLDAAELDAVLYLVRLHWLFDGVVRRPNFAVLTGTLNRRFLRTLKRSVVAGERSQLDFLQAR
jgi:hypothetical protein